MQGMEFAAADSQVALISLADVSIMDFLCEPRSEAARIASVPPSPLVPHLGPFYFFWGRISSSIVGVLDLTMSV